jgi:hypothetical protein
MTTPTTPTSLLNLHTHQPLLIDLHFALHWFPTKHLNSDSNLKTLTSTPHSQAFPPVTFAADVLTPEPENWNPSAFLQSLDETCLDRIRALTKYTIYNFIKPVNYEVERWFVWHGVGDPEEEGEARVGIRGLSAFELEAQLRMVRERGYRDWVRVEMAVEIEAGRELEGRGRVWEVAEWFGKGDL